MKALAQSLILRTRIIFYIDSTNWTSSSNAFNKSNSITQTRNLNFFPEIQFYFRWLENSIIEMGNVA